MQNVQVKSHRLTVILFDRKITYPQLAKKIGISGNSLQQKINGQRRWWIDECVSIAKYLGYEDLREVFPEVYEHILKNIAS